MSASQPANFNLQEFSDAGLLLLGGRLYTYAYGTTTQKTCYADPAGTIPHTYTADGAGGQYIALNARGELPAPLYLAPDPYDLALKRSDGSTVWTRRAEGVVVDFLQAGLGATLRTEQDKGRDIVSVKDFGAKGDGTADDTTAIQKALNTGKAVYFPTPSVAYYVTADLMVLTGQLIYGDGYKSMIQLIDGTINGFLCTSINRATIRDLRISTKTQANATAYKAAVNLVSSGYCLVENVHIDGMGYNGIRLYDSSNNRIKGNVLSAFFGTVQDQADIAVMNNSGYNLVEGNTCLGGSAGYGDHGIFIQDPYTNSTPTGNKIIGNEVGAHNANGIIVYVTTAYDTQTIVANNRVSGIRGTALAGLSGAGIYIQSAGGTIVTGNHVSDCCKQTTNFSTQGVGHIAIAIGQYGAGQLTAVVVSNNHINAPRGPGMWLATSDAPIIAEGNTLLITSTGGSDEGRGIYAVNCQGVRIARNTVTQSNSNFQTIQVTASGQNVSGADVSDNWVKTVAYGIAINIAAGGTHSDHTVKNNRVYNGNQTAMTLEKITNLLCIGNDLDSSGVVFTATNIVGGRYSANRIYSSSGGYGVIFTGTTGSNNIVDESNILGSVVENDATSGTLISQYGTAGPASSGLWANGDRVIARQPAVGNPKGWRCTAAGNPGTWTSEGNL